MMFFIGTTQPEKNFYRIFYRRRVDNNRLETTFQGSIFFNSFAIFIQSCCANALQFSAGKCRFNNVGSIHRALAASSTHQRVDFVDEEDDVALGAHYLLNYAFEPLLKLALVLGAGYQCTHIK